MRTIDPVKAQEFAIATVRRLREAGYTALWAGGCVRDRLMGREPKDYDVATNALPEQIRDVFGRRRTLPIGASFGVISVVGDKLAGQIDVATFRRDAGYSDGRHPDAVTFSTPEEDAQRRDFTINGLFFDPLDATVYDYVGGQEDLQRCVVRAIGDAQARFHEDKLRVLRALRFAATLGFEIEAGTWNAVLQLAPQIRVVSAERVTEELRRMLVHPSRTHAVELLRGSGLLYEILPEAAGILPRHEPSGAEPAFAWDRTVRILEHLHDPSFAVALAALWREIVHGAGSAAGLLIDLRQRWRLSNDDAAIIRLCYEHEALLRRARDANWAQVQRVLILPQAEALLDYAEAVATVLDGDTSSLDLCRERLRWPREQIDPPPLANGYDLRQLGIPAGPVYRELLDELRDAQLLQQVTTQEAALDWIRRQWIRRQ